MFNEQLLAGRRILVTGGGTGLGKSMAGRFLEELKTLLENPIGLVVS